MMNKVAISVNSLLNGNYIKHAITILHSYNNIRYSFKINLVYSEDINLVSDQSTYLVTHMVEFTHWLINLFVNKESKCRNLLHAEFNLIFLVQSEPNKEYKS